MQVLEEPLDYLHLSAGLTLVDLHMSFQLQAQSCSQPIVNITLLGNLKESTIDRRMDPSISPLVPQEL